MTAEEVFDSPIYAVTKSDANDDVLYVYGYNGQNDIYRGIIMTKINQSAMKTRENHSDIFLEKISKTNIKYEALEDEEGTFIIYGYK